MKTMLIATRNRHKVGEIRAILGGSFQYLTLNDFPDAPKVVEDGPTFAGNAAKKAVELARWLAGSQPSTLPPPARSRQNEVTADNPQPSFVLADDSGLEVDALDGAPGVHSARFAAVDSAKSGNTADADNNAKLLHLLKDVPPEKRTARFRCVIALVQVPSPQSTVHSPQLFDGACEGRIIFEPRGNNGFGYDPLFVPVGLEKTFAELGEDVKNKLSHRAKALEKIKAHIVKLPGGG